MFENYNLLLDEIVQKNISHYGEHSATYKEFIDNLFHNKSLFNSFLVEYKKVTLYLEVLLQNSEFIFDTETSDEIWDVFWGTQFSLSGNRKLLERIQQYSKRYAIAELGFINRIAFPTDVYKYSQSISFMFDDLAPYYDARFPNRLEQMLNDKSIVITEEQKQRARSCIDRIVETHLTKYNHQPIFEPKIGRENVSKVLVVDQVRGDMSISKGLGCDETFKNMLDSAIKENPNADIIVKTHPDTIAGAGGYYTRLEEHDNIYTQTKGINPISLIKYVDKVYVCTSQFGFEALMCGKEVHVFGMPFYAGWGLTKDRQNCNRRTNIRSLEEVFYIAYIMYSYYVNPDKKCPCEIEEAIDYLLKLREEYNKSKKG